MEVTIEVDTRAAVAQLSRTSDNIDRALLAGMTDATVLLVNQMRVYPPQRTGSAYKRTNTLKGSWQRYVDNDGADLVGRVVSNSNVAPYNRFVQDATMQSRVHAGRWTNTAQNVAERSTAQINEMFANRIRAAIGG
jgi:hypothetical protein